MSVRVQILHGGSNVKNGDFSAVHGLAKLKRPTSWSWSCGKETKADDKLLIYFERPHSAIIASGVALKDAKPGKYYRYITKIGDLQILSAPISIDEMRKRFPRWKWLNYPRAKQYLDDRKAGILLKRASLRLKTPPVSVKISGAGFGTPEQNRLVEKGACRAVKRHFAKRGYKVVSREKENIGYDFDVTKKSETIHVEVKGTSGSTLTFPITANEVNSAKTDSKFKLAVVTEATTPQKKVHIFDAKGFLKGFGLTPLAYFAKSKESLRA